MVLLEDNLNQTYRLDFCRLEYMYVNYPDCLFESLFAAVQRKLRCSLDGRAETAAYSKWCRRLKNTRFAEITI
jgi:hypothetical protein